MATTPLPILSIFPSSLLPFRVEWYPRMLAIKFVYVLRRRNAVQFLVWWMARLRHWIRLGRSLRKKIVGSGKIRGRLDCEVNKPFFTPISRSYTSLPLDGIIFLVFFYLDMQKSRNLSCLDPFIPTSYARGERKKNQLVWAWIQHRFSCFNCPQAAALTTRPCLLGREVNMVGPDGRPKKLARKRSTEGALGVKQTAFVAERSKALFVRES